MKPPTLLHNPPGAVLRRPCDCLIEPNHAGRILRLESGVLGVQYPAHDNGHNSLTTQMILLGLRTGGAK